MRFNWDTEEQHSWDEAPEGAGEARQLGRTGRAALWAAALVAVIALLGLGLWTLAQQRASEVQERVKADVLAGHELAQRAAVEGDEELFLNLMATDDEAWAEAQEELLEAELLYEGAARFYELTPVATSDVSQTVTLDPELQVATVEVERPFVTAARAGVTQTVRLRQTHVYVQQDGGWLLAPPSSEFWSRQWGLNGEMVHVTYHRRDEAVALRLLNVLEDTLPQMCELRGLECAEDLHVVVSLEPDPQLLIEASEPGAMIEGSNEVLLPSPTLVGAPVDEEGVELVARTYASQVMTRVMSHVAQYECCRQGLLVRAILERQLHHLGLRSWPLGPEEYERLLEVGIDETNAYGMTSSSMLHILQRPAYRDTWWRVLSLVEMREATLPRTVLLSELGAAPQYWLIEEYGSTAEFIRSWIEFVYERSRSGQMTEPPQPLPVADIQLVCMPAGSQATGSSEATVWRYDLQEERWSEELVHDAQGTWQTASVYPLATANGYIIEEHRRALNQAGVQTRLLWRRAGEERIIMEERAGSGGPLVGAYFSGTDPGGRYVLVFKNYYEGDGLYTEELSLLDLETCVDGECETVVLSGYPKWSPDGSRTLLEVEPEPNENVEFRPAVQLYHAGPKGQDPAVVGRGYGSFWLDNDHYGYLRSVEGETAQELVVGNVRTGEAHVLASTTDFAALLAQPSPEESSLRINHVVRNLSDPRRLLVHALASRGGTPQVNGYLFSVRLSSDYKRSDDIMLLLRANDSVYSVFAPNGRWALVSALETLFVIDLTSDETVFQGRNVGPSRWSPDGEWLVQQREHYLLLYAPDSNYRRVVVRDSAGCRGLYWQ